MKRMHLQCAGFLALLVLVLAAVSWVFYPKDNQDIGERQDRLSTGLLAEEKNSVDVLFLGDSLPMYSTVSIQIWGDYGIPCYTYATPQQNMVKTRRMFLDALRIQSPKMILLETNTLYREFSSQEVTADFFYELVPAARYHDNWKRVPLSRMIAPIRYEAQQSSKGYYLTMHQCPPLTLRNYMEYNDLEAEPQSTAVELLKDIWRRCKKDGIRLALYSVPNFKNWSNGRHQIIAALAREMDIPYLDLNVQKLDINWETDSLDHGDHLNYLGARKVTAYLGQWLWNTDLFTDKRADPAYTHWNQQYERFSGHAAEALDTGLIPE